MKKFPLISLPLCAVVLAAMLVALTPRPVQAGGPFPCDLLSDCVFVTFPGGGTFGFPFFDPGEGLAVLPLMGGMPPLVGGGPVLLELFEPAAEGGGISDVLLFTGNITNPICNNSVLCFGSDPNPGGGIGSLITQILTSFPTGILTASTTETGALQDVAGLLGITSARVQVLSDVSAPEPSTILLLGSGLAGLAYWRRRK